MMYILFDVLSIDFLFIVYITFCCFLYYYLRVIIFYFDFFGLIIYFIFITFNFKLLFFSNSNLFLRKIFGYFFISFTIF
jgi:hypothetical protein